MSSCTATLCVWVTEIGDPCRIMETEKMYVHVLLCNGKPLEWCKRKYSFIPTECGHVEIKVPPGCYSVLATHSPQGQGVKPLGNRLTHIQVVRVNCGDEVCVTLFSPSMWHCGHWFGGALKTQLHLFQGKDRVIATAAVKAIDALMNRIDRDQYAAQTGLLLEQDPLK